MKTILNLLQDDTALYLDEALYTFESNKEIPCDIMICPAEHLETASLLVNPKECFFIAALNDKDEQSLVPDIFDAWILRSSLLKLPSMLEAYDSYIEQKIKLRVQREIIERFSVDTSVHNANLDGIKLNMQESTKEIENIFEERVEEMRKIHRDAKGAHEKLTVLKEQTAPAAFAELEDSWSMTESILSRTDEVIKAMFGFIMVLQCEDRISQMIEGIEKIMQDDVAFAELNGFSVKDELKTELKKRLIAFYTIQDQRDYASGIEDAMQGCNIEQPNIEELLLF
ncbi:MAG: hypothetical protein RBT52_08470 [Sulfurimonas sp.]|jgi:hypothetical protein|nr:hypothetical protein [Sulfurimonas sp.]